MEDVFIISGATGEGVGALLDAVLPMLDEPVEGEEDDAPEAEKPWSPI